MCILNGLKIHSSSKDSVCQTGQCCINSLSAPAWVSESCSHVWFSPGEVKDTGSSANVRKAELMSADSCVDLWALKRPSRTSPRPAVCTNQCSIFNIMQGGSAHFYIYGFCWPSLKSPKSITLPLCLSSVFEHAHRLLDG